MPITPFSGMVDSAIKFQRDPNLWVVPCLIDWPVGAEDPPPDENYISIPSTHEVEIDGNMVTVAGPPGAIGFKRIDETRLCVPDAAGEVRYRTQRYRLINTEEEAYTKVARWVYVRASLNYYEHNTRGEGIIGNVSFNQVCLVAGIRALAEFDQETVLRPTEVDVNFHGRVVCVANHYLRQRDGAMRDIMEFIREFRA